MSAASETNKRKRASAAVEAVVSTPTSGSEGDAELSTATPAPQETAQPSTKRARRQQKEQKEVTNQVLPEDALAKLRPKGYPMNPPPTDRPVRVYADGVFDLFHLGHMRQLEQAKKAFPNTFLLVGIPSDTETHKRKGLTVLTDKERAESLRHCKWVDEVIEDAPWIVTPDFLEKHEIDYVAHDDEPYVSAECDDIYKPCKEQGKFMVTQRTEGISTTYIITKIVRDYEKYISRQLSRGASRQELNLSWLKKNEMDIKRHVAELRETIKQNWSTTGRELRDEFKNYWAPSPRPANGRDMYQFGSSSGASNGNASNGNNANGNANANGRTSQDGHASDGHRSPKMNPNWEHLGTPSRPQSPQTEFANGFSLGLIGGVRSWMQNRASRPGSMAASDDNSSDEDVDPKEPKTPSKSKSSSKAASVKASSE